ncbi:hypothetical protein VNO77_01895 [Canavalia gladiata]|uniref:Uncharacterized protein n=1 Tax=Canavalia gladiata TaxID=3824 RepID=A0AAN9R5E4_CANGL
MGNCNCSSSQTTRMATAKVVVHDGRMEEFSHPVKVSYLLQQYPACFICDSDDLSFDGVVSAVHEDEELQPGQLYFALPLNQLKRHLPLQEMAALAVKASSALSKSGGFRRKQIVLVSSEGNGKPFRRVLPEVGGDVPTVDRLRGGGSRRGSGRGKFEATLSSIPE